MSSDRGQSRDWDVNRMMGTEPVSRERVSTDRGSEMVSTEPPTQARETTLRNEIDNTILRKTNTDIPKILPHERVFPIQIGSELFRLSGASISSDAPSYFSQFFQCQLETARKNGEDTNSVRTLYIDRDPVTFKDISLHLQGYHITPRDGPHFVKLFADAQFYSLPKLISQIYEESIFISIGDTEFRIPRDLFSDPGNSPNYFSLGFAVFFSTPLEVFPGLSREGLLRPPSILPPSIPNRSAKTFGEILHLLRGYPLEIRSEDHRAELLRDCKYFHLKGLEQKLIRHEISYNLTRKRHEITLRLEDVRQSGISVIGDPAASSPGSEPATPNTATATASPTPFQALPNLVGFVNYARPFVDAQPYELLLQIGASETRLHLSTSRAEFFGDTKTRISRFLEVVATKLNLPTTQPLGLFMKKGGRGSQPASPGWSGVSEDLVRVVFDDETSVRLDGQEWNGAASTLISSGTEESRSNTHGTGASSFVDVSGDDAWQDPPSKRRRTNTDGSVHIGNGSAPNTAVPGTAETGVDFWVIKTGLWRLRVQNRNNSASTGSGRGVGVECVLVAVKLEAVSGERGRNKARVFLAE